MIKHLDGYDYDYSIDEFGNVFKNGKKMCWSDNGLGYQRIRLLKNHKRISIYIHRLVYQTFIGEIPEGYEINHIDHNKSNNHISNLELVSHSENMHKAFLQYGYFGSMNRPLNMQTLSQAKDTSLEGAETIGEVKAS